MSSLCEWADSNYNYYDLKASELEDGIVWINLKTLKNNRILSPWLQSLNKKSIVKKILKKNIFIFCRKITKGVTYSRYIELTIQG